MIKNSFEEAGVYEEFVEDGYVYIKLSEFLRAQVVDDDGNLKKAEDVIKEH